MVRSDGGTAGAAVSSARGDGLDPRLSYVVSALLGTSTAAQAALLQSSSSGSPAFLSRLRGAKSKTDVCGQFPQDADGGLMHHPRALDPIFFFVVYPPLCNRVMAMHRHLGGFCYGFFLNITTK